MINTIIPPQYGDLAEHAFGAAAIQAGNEV
ncbi:hypothetical protein EDD55_103296 [Varunaivibrio sulfuroxidans]|uniref:Uncharacterized protein n=1 Tax=Varunaivibrio sulfuroxidans TaxID=1773489 RepID=A0A4R3JD09_9PROT|nr:hypothetical protein EDD55_103296 [Varunaivibrio sulfuroxidans]